MDSLIKFLKEFWIDENNYYGDLKATIIYLLFSALQILFVVGIYAWKGIL
jgi:hypothetical protein